MDKSLTQDRNTLPRVSVAVIAKNEEDRIGRLLRSTSFADEIVVVDSGSSDGTVEICRAGGARVVHHHWMGYAAQKQLALETARGDWILNLDADEAISEESAAEMLRAIHDADSAVGGFSMPRMSRYLNRWIRHGGWYPDRKIRLVRKGRARWVGDGLHERLEVDGTVVELTHPLLHYVYRGISDQLRTIDRFSTVFAEQRGTPASRLYVVWGLFHAVGKFLECAFWKLGLLDGLPGLVIAVNSSFYVFLKHAKAWEQGLPEDKW
ncbi:MAG: glycosyltransferase family 2 protein [Desulfomonilaceae bacterium]|nr:glycosyltransferase family 2 protein [Desulfomonilaceae bacterium]